MAGYDPSAWQGQMSDWINAPPQIQAPQYAAPQTNYYTPNLGSTGSGIPYSNANGGYGAIQAGASPNASGSFGQKYNNFMGTYGESIGQGISAAGALFNLYGGIKSLGLMSKQFKLAKKVTKIGVDNAARSGNNSIAHHETATRNSAERRGDTRERTQYTPFQGFNGVPT
jgi:hypothetical protein